MLVRRRGRSAAQEAAAVAAEATARNAAITAALDPVTTLSVFDDFLSGIGTTGQLGALGWSFAGGTVAGLVAETNHHGIIRRTTSASINTIAHTRLFLSTGQGALLPAASFDLTWIFRLNSNDANTEFRIGLANDWTTLLPAAGVYLEKMPADTSWFAVARSATQTRTAAIAAVDTGWHKIRIRRVDASTIGYTLDALTEVTLATDVPALTLFPGTHISNSAAADKTADLDLMWLKITGLVR